MATQIMSGINGRCPSGLGLLLLVLAIAGSSPIGPWLSTAIAQEPAAAQAPAAPVETDEQRRERIAAERFLQVLQRRPRTGTALDRIYGYHVQNGSLEQFVQQLRDQAESKDETENDSEADGNAWMLLGLVQLRRGEELDAIGAFGRATELLADDCMAPYYMGRAHALLGEPDRAAEALEEALRRSPPRTELLEIGKTLGRLYQRQQQADEAARVWQQLTEAFPGDTRVAEAVAAILAEEGNYAAALERFAGLAGAAKDPSRRVQYAVRAAEMKLRLGDSQAARSDLESQLARLNPDSWLFRDVRRRIEASFTDASDYDGLSEYYANWIKEHPDDIDAMLRAGRTLALQGRLPEARQWFEQAIERAPSENEPREALIGALLGEEKFAEAATQYASLHELAPDDPDVIIRWGETLLADREVPVAERQKAAAEVWNKLVERRPDDAVTASQVADLMRAAEQTERAIALYEKAIELAPDAPQYREYLGEYLHRLDRGDEAQRVWAELAAGSRRTRENLVRLAEVYATFDHHGLALKAMGEASEMDPTLAERLRYAQMLRADEQYPAADEQLQLAAPLAETPEEREQLLSEQIEVYQAAGELTERIAEARQAVAAPSNTEAKNLDTLGADAWIRLARLLQADRQVDEAAVAAGRAVELAPDSINAWTTAAELRERSGQYGAALEAYRRLADIDQRYRSNHLTQIASLHMRLGNAEAALEAGRELLASGATNPENYRFFADLCFRLGEDEQGLDALRRGVRAAPNDRDALLTLARTLAEQFRTDEAIELYWQAFEAAEDLDAKSDAVTQLAELYLRSGRFEQLIERLEISGREGREGEGRREADLLIAAAHEASGDTGTARQLLDDLLAASPRDTLLLQRLVDLATRDNDTVAAAEYQRALNEIAPSREGDSRLARLLIDLGEIEQAEAIWMRLSRGEDADQQLLSTIDGALQRGEWDTAIKISQRLLADQPDDWETLARLAIAFRMSDEQDAEAADAARRLLAVDLPRETLSREAEAQQAARAARSTSGDSAATLQASLPPSYSLANAYYTFRQLLAPRSGDPYGSSGTGFRSQVSHFYLARAAAIGVLLGIAQEAEQTEPFLDSLEQSAEEAAESSRGQLALWDLDIALQLMAGPPSQDPALAERQLRIAERLAERFGAEGKARYVMIALQAQRPTNFNGSQVEPEPLPEATLDKIQEYMEAVVAEAPLLATLLSRQTVVQLMQAGREQAAITLAERVIALEAESQYAAMHRSTQAFLISRLGDRQRLRQFLRGSNHDLEYVQLALMQFAQQMREEGDFQPLVDEDLDLLIDTVATVYEGLRPSQRAATSSGSADVYVQTFVGKEVGNRLEILGFPPSTPVWDARTLRTLHWLWSVSKVGEVEDAFVERLRQPKGENESATRRMVRLAAAAFVQHWSGDPKASEQLLTEALEADPTCNALRVVLAQQRYASGDKVGALQVVEAIQPLSSQLVEQRELAMLQLASQLGDRSRAQQAARRLYAMRLDSSTQLMLAQHMTALGMNDLADNLVRRIQQRAGSQSQTLQEVMRGLSAMGKTEAAAEVAMQILTRTRATSSTSGSRSSEEYLRREAVQMLAAANRLEPLIERLERQATAAPKSARIASELAELYVASGRREKAAEVLQRIGDAGSQSPEALIQLALRSSQAGEHAKAMENLVAALHQKPELLSNYFYNFRESLKTEGGYAALVDEMLDTGLDKYERSYHYMDTMLVEGWQQEEHRESLKRLMIAMFDAGPRMAGAAIGSAATCEGALDDPQIFTALRDALLTKDTSAGAASWSNLNGAISVGSGGEINGTLTRLAKSKNTEQIAQLADLTDQAHRADPEWAAMHALAAGFAAAADRPERAAELVKPLLEEKEGPLDPQAAWQLGLVFLDSEPLFKQAVQLLELAAERETSFSDNFQYSPKAALVAALPKVGRRSEARQLLLSAVEAPQPDRSNYPAGYQAQQKISSMQGIAEGLLELDYPLDAIQLCDVVLEDSDLLAEANRGGGSSEYYLSQLRRTRISANTKLTPERCVAAIEERIDAARATPAAARQPAADGEPGAPGESKTPPADALGELLQPRIVGNSLSQLKVDCMLSQLTRSAARNDEGRTQLAELAGRITAAAPPTEPSLDALVVRAVVAAAAEDDAVLGETIPMIADRWESIANDDTNAATMALKTWPAVAAALDCEAPVAAAKPLSDRLVGLVGDAKNSRAHLALLRQLNEIAQVRDRPEEATRSLEQLAAEILPPTDGEGATAEVKTQQAASAAERAEWALELAELAIQQDNATLSIAAVNAALADGPPLPQIDTDLVLGSSRMSSIQISSQSQTPDPISEAENRVGGLLVRLSDAWKKYDVSAEAAYEALRDAILPADGDGMHAYLVRNAEDDPQNSTATFPNYRSGLAELVAWAVRAERQQELVDLLQQRAEKRPESAIGIEVVRVLLALHSDPDASDAAHLPRISELLATRSDAYTTVLVCHAAVPALASEILAPAALEVLRQLLPQMLAAEGRPRVYGRDAQLLPEKIGRQIIALDLQRDNVEAARQWVLQLIAARHRRNANAQGYGDRMEKQLLADVVPEFFNTPTAIPVGMQLLQRHDQIFVAGSSSNLDALRPGIARALRTLPGKIAYEGLRQLCLPQSDEEPLHLDLSFVKYPPLPATVIATAEMTAADQPPALRAAPLTGALPALLTAAERSGNLESLVDELRAMQAAGRGGADVALALALDHAGQEIPMELLEKLEAEIEKRVPEAMGSKDQPSLDHLAVAVTAARRESTAAQATKMLEHLLRHCQRSAFAAGQSLVNDALYVAAADKGDMKPVAETPFWTIASDFASYSMPVVPSRWLAGPRKLTHISGPHQDYLFLRMPLEGDFDLTWRQLDGGWQPVGAVVSGVVASPRGFNDTILIDAIGHREHIVYQQSVIDKGKANEMRLRVRGDSWELLINDQPIYREQHAGTSFPFVGWQGLYHFKSPIEEITFEGTPRVLDKVALLDDPRLRGWTGWQSGSKLSPADVAEPVELVFSSRAGASTPVVWEWEEGELKGVRGSLLNTPTQHAVLHYMRPLHSGERVEYEFYYEPGVSEVHPVLDDVAMVLQPEGVHLRWLGNIRSRNAIGPEPDRLLEDPQGQLHDGTVPLKANAWNKLILVLEKDHLRLELNGVPIYRYNDAHSEAHQRRIGFTFQPHDSEARVRGATLRGDWPKEIPGVLVKEVEAGAP